LKLLFVFLQLLNVWVSEQTNDSDEPIFSNSLLSKTTVIVLEEYIQEYTSLNLVSDKESADIIVYSKFVKYIRPNTEINFFTLRSKTETVGLEMVIEFYYPKWNYREPIYCITTIDKDIRSNFLSVAESEEDFADSMIMNLIKKTISVGFRDSKLLL